MDAKFLEKFYAAPLAAQQQTIGLITTKLLQTPEDKARMGLVNAQTGQVNASAGLIGAQAQQYKDSAAAAAQGTQAQQSHAQTLGAWSKVRGGGAGTANPAFAGPIQDAAPGDVLPALPPLPPTFRTTAPALQ